MWAQRNVVSEDGYGSLAATAAEDPQLQVAMASELTTQIIELAADNGYDLNNTELVRGVTSYTPPTPASPAVRPGQPHRPPLDVHRHDSR